MNPLEFTTLVRAEKELWWFRGMRKILFQLLDPIAAARPIRRVLEAGCGTAHFSRLLEQRYGWRVFPSDIASVGLRFARLAGTRRLMRADIGSLPFPPASFDAVLCLDVLVHFQKGDEFKPMSEFA